MTRRLALWAVVFAVSVVPARAVHAQQAGAPPKPTLVPLDIEVVLSRYQGDKKISSVPYTLNVNANGDQTTLNMGTEVPVPATTFAPASGNSPSPPLRSYNYRPIGTVIELRATLGESGVYQLQISIDDSSVFSTTASSNQAAIPVAPDMPAFRSFRGRNTVLLRDGQTRQYTVATDRVTGEVLKVDVTLKVLK